MTEFNRPVYETTNCMKNEIEIRMAVAPIIKARGWGDIVKETNRRSGIDCWAFDVQTYGRKKTTKTACFEIKNRRGIDFEVMKNAIISTQKINGMMRWWKEFQIPAFLIFRDKRGSIRFLQVEENFMGDNGYLVKWGGRSDRRDPLDMELCFKMRLGDFKPIGDFPERKV